MTSTLRPRFVLAFDGNSGFVKLPRASVPVGSKVSLTFWAYGGDSLPKPCAIFAAVNGEQRVLGVHLPWSNAMVYFDCGCQGSQYNRISKRSAAADYKGRWSHWGMTLDAEIGKMAIYLDGELWCQGGGKTLFLPQAEAVQLGCWPGQNGGYQGYSGEFSSYHGYLGEVSIWDRALSQGAVQRLMSTALQGPELGLVSHYPLDEGFGEIAHDRSGTGHDGTLEGGATWVEMDVPFPSPPVRAPGLVDWTYWWRWKEGLAEQTAEGAEPFRRGRIWS